MSKFDYIYKTKFRKMATWSRWMRIRELSASSRESIKRGETGEEDMSLIFLGSRTFYFFGAYYSTIGWLQHDPPIKLPYYSRGEQYSFYLEDIGNHHQKALWHGAIKQANWLWKIERAIEKRKDLTLKKLRELDIGNLPDKELFGSYKSIIDFFLYYQSRGNSVARLLDHFGIDVLRTQLKKVGIPNVENAITILTVVQRVSYLAREEAAFWAGVLKFHRKQDFAKFIDEHLKKYAYITLSFYNEPPLDRKALLKRLKTPRKNWRKKVYENENRIRETTTAYKKFIKSNRIPPNIIKSATVLRNSAGLKDAIRGYLAEIWYHSEKIFKELAYRTKLSVLEVKTLKVEEVKGILLNKKRPNHSLISSRLEGPTVCLIRNNKTNLIYGIKAKQIIKADFEQQVNNQVNLINGRPASAGIAQGKVRVVENLNEAKKLREGEILVVSNTNPAFVPYLSKVAGIITEEGGITIHAAIVSREMGIPCIVGVKLARQVFNDGDLVEVDANKGIVRKISK